ncbi:RNA-binding La domain-containing protein [Zostera marina]|uniref:RNA-binding La domain-containing protein n=1 Tax=Zostera marina TaxID=29655 RepID=A0A0K9P524_ZOSMR|nr:RNA-binding La domain-containing protein [Zostera marina]
MASTLNLDQHKCEDVIRQVEFYFSDSNLPRDRFLKKAVYESHDGLVSLSLLCSFSQMKKHTGLKIQKGDDVPDETIQTLAGILRKSSFLKVSEDGKRVGRNIELIEPEAIIEQVDSKTISVSPLPHDVRIDDMEKFFGEYGKVNSVRLPRHVANKKHFCGTALVEFSEDLASKLFKETLFYAGSELQIKPKKDFDSERFKMRKALKNSCSDKSEPNENGSYVKGLILSFKLAYTSKKPHMYPSKSTSVEDQKNAVGSVDETDESVSKSKGEEKENIIQKNSKEKKNIIQKNSEEKDRNHGKNVLLREHINEFFQRFGIIKFIDYKIGDESGYIQFDSPDATIKARSSASLAPHRFVVKGCTVTIDSVSGEAEREYWSVPHGGSNISVSDGNNKDGKHKRELEKENHVEDRRQNKVQRVTF